MTAAPRYALHLPDGRWAYYLPDPDRPPGTRTGLFADGEPLHRLDVHVDPQGWWYATGRHAETITAVYQPSPQTIGYQLNDPAAESERYPAELTVEDYRQRSASREEYWELYDRVTKDLEPVEYVYEGPFIPLVGREAPHYRDEPPWQAELPYELSQRPEFRHLFPGRIPGLKDYLAAQIKSLPRIEYCFVDYQGKRGLHVTLKVPFDQPRTAFRANIGRRGQPLKSGRTVRVLVSRNLDLPVPDTVSGPNYEAALTEWHRQVAYWLAQVEEASAAACSACDGKGYVPTSDSAPTATEARTRLSAYVTHESDADAAEFEAHITAVIAAETAELREQVARVRAFATSSKYRWLEELLDGSGSQP